ncbi:hypothetical protein CB0940_09966 [Cercospora beticola]|uniref:SnoaL-like domain-containing protein n=1 Tax=Cercospora beticola TaxID=122368 RepID=A0A2G5HHI8_CERBT|nr:hypothetical protein CB0940_09966 [Cercospora beticola]PIA92056.1 hypothetical protein CB0940_09966 [Cercospora beticola]WPB05683.1 hypothetical protein RHO25_010337 [Cercospora beticola]CAK1365529.1 unnamed protein product [Cercospora beticola]
MADTNENIARCMRVTTEAFLQTWTGNWVHALEANLALRAPECSHTILPSSLGRKNETNDVWASKFSKVMSLVTESTMTLEDYISVPAERRAVARSSVKAQSPVGSYENDYVWFLNFDEEGKKIVKIVEFVDGLAAKELLGKLKEGGYVE